MKVEIELTEKQKKQSDELCNKIIDTIKDNIDLEDKLNQALVIYTLALLLKTIQTNTGTKLDEVRYQDD